MNNYSNATAVIQSSGEQQTFLTNSDDVARDDVAHSIYSYYSTENELFPY